MNMLGPGRLRSDLSPANLEGTPDAPLGLMDYLQKILTARVYDVAVESPLELAKRLSERLGNRVWLKREDCQPVFSFKLRGAYNKMARLSSEQLGRGVICASAGNHAQGVALSAGRLGCRAVIVMPVTTPKLKIDAVRSYQGEVILHGDSYSDAYLHALELSKLHDYIFVHPFNDPDVIAGQGTVGMEILRSTSTRSTRSSLRSAAAASSPGWPRTSRPCGPRSRSSACKWPTPTRWFARSGRASASRSTMWACLPMARRSSW